MSRFVMTLLLLLLILPPVMAEARQAGDASKPATVRREIKSILAQPEYNRFADQKENALSRWWKKNGEKIAEFVQRIFRLPRDERGLGRTLSYTLAGLVMLAFLILLWLIIRKTRRLQRGSGTDRATLDFSTYGLPSPVPLIKHASELADAGDYRGAFLAAYIASISILDERKAIRWERGRTNWEYLRQLQNSGFQSQYNDLRPLSFDFDRKVYGREACNVDDYHRALDVYNRIAMEVAA